MTRLLYLKLNDASGRLFSSERLVHRDGIFKLETFLPPGLYSFLGRCLTGASAEGSFELGASMSAKQVFEFTLH